jgi:nucleolar protein 14
MPECLNFLNRSLILLSPKKTFAHEIPGFFPMPEEGTTVELSIQDSEGKGIESISAIKLEQLSIESEESSDELRLSLLQGTLRMLERYLQLYASTPALLEVFQDAHRIVSKLSATIVWHTDIEVTS